MNPRRAALGMLLLSTVVGAQSFEVASVKPDKSGNPPKSNFPLGPGDVYVSNGGLFAATGFPLITCIAFAWEMIGNQSQFLVPQLPSWAMTGHYDIQARAHGNAREDEMRVMMRSLLADRFKLAIHDQKREVPMLAFVLTKAGKPGPQLRLHPPKDECGTDGSGSATAQTVDGGFPALCNGIFNLPASRPGRLRLGGRNVTLKFIADSLSAGALLGRPMVDQTGLDAPVGFLLEFVPDTNGPASPDPKGPTLEQALRDQLRIKLTSTKAAMDVLVLDHVERPSEN